MKTRIIILCVSICVLFSLSAGNQQNAWAAEKVVIKYATSPPYTKGSPLCEITVKLKQLAAIYSKGKIDIQIFWGGQLGTEQKVFKDCQMGIIQMVQANIANLSPFARALYAVVLPYIFDSREEAYRLFRGELGEYFNQQTIKLAGLRVLAWPDQSYRALHNTKRRVRSLEDMKGLKWRVPNNPVFIEEYKSWGINPIPMAWSEVFSSLQTGVIHGGDNVLRNLVDFKLYEIEKYATVTKHMIEFVPIVIGEEFFKKQPKDIQMAITKAASDAWAWGFFAMAEDDERTKQFLRKKGMTIDEPDITPWKERASKIWPKFYDKAGGKEIFDKILSFK
ncbi:MAG: TRAP transporter substrate-binding protein [Deltaproteobacteria bacterium]|nr:TRAP transporter substrate-binding protein [Deltaproteobacteria bacterium]MBW1961421.1 TRAP transporter substrate-binding protein [Deltaproteobacteria bacterium]MBW2154885.1 TRAP transporter substrate-binding protein [Deltaproteobacteria bacterium]